MFDVSTQTIRGETDWSSQKQRLLCQSNLHHGLSYLRNIRQCLAVCDILSAFFGRSTQKVTSHDWIEAVRLTQPQLHAVIEPLQALPVIVQVAAATIVPERGYRDSHGLGS